MFELAGVLTWNEKPWHGKPNSPAQFVSQEASCWPISISCMPLINQTPGPPWLNKPSHVVFTSPPHRPLWEPVAHQKGFPFVCVLFNEGFASGFLSFVCAIVHDHSVLRAERSDRLSIASRTISGDSRKPRGNEMWLLFLNTLLSSPRDGSRSQARSALPPIILSVSLSLPSRPYRHLCFYDFPMKTNAGISVCFRGTPSLIFLLTGQDRNRCVFFRCVLLGSYVCAEVAYLHCFLGAECGLAAGTWPGTSRTSGPKARPVGLRPGHLGHPRWSLPTCTRPVPTTGQRPVAARWEAPGRVWDRDWCSVCQWCSYGSRRTKRGRGWGGCSQAQHMTQTGQEGAKPQKTVWHKPNPPTVAFIQPQHMCATVKFTIISLADKEQSNAEQSRWDQHNYLSLPQAQTHTTSPDRFSFARVKWKLWFSLIPSRLGKTRLV